MSSREDTAIDRIALKFLVRSLHKSEWTQAAHFGAVVWMVRAGRTAEIPDRIRAYNTATGVSNTATTGYHETITRASLDVASLALGSEENTPLSTVLIALLGTRFGGSTWPLVHWSRHRLFTPEARAAWVSPDLAPFEPATAYRFASAASHAATCASSTAIVTGPLSSTTS